MADFLCIYVLRVQLLHLYQNSEFTEAIQLIEQNPMLQFPAKNHNLLSLGLAGFSMDFLEYVMQLPVINKLINLRQGMRYRLESPSKQIYFKLRFYELVDMDQMDISKWDDWEEDLVNFIFQACDDLEMKQRYLAVIKRMMIHEHRVYAQECGLSPQPSDENYLEKMLSRRFYNLDMGDKKDCRRLCGPHYQLMYCGKEWRHELTRKLYDRPVRRQVSIRHEKPPLINLKDFDIAKLHADVLHLLVILMPPDYRFDAYVIKDWIEGDLDRDEQPVLRYMLSTAGFRYCLQHFIFSSKFCVWRYNIHGRDDHVHEAIISTRKLEYSHVYLGRTDSEQLYAMMILLSDKYLELKEKAETYWEEVARYFFRLTSRLSLFLQMRVALAYSGRDGFIGPEKLDSCFQKALRIEFASK